MSILHVDLNSFYASCAVVASDGKYNFDTPLIVCGDPAKRHGIVLAATYVVKSKGVGAGMPLNEAMRLCPEAILVGSDFRLYKYYSDKFMAILRNYSPLIMRYGIDEAYIDYTGCEHIFGTPIEVAEIIRQRVKKELGLTVSIGIGDNLLMAKMGSDYKKPDAITIIDHDAWNEKIMPLPVDRLMYVGRHTAEKLNQLGIMTIEQLSKSSPIMLESIFGVNGRVMFENANGIDKQKITLETDPIKGISNSMTLAGDAITKDEMLSALMFQVEKVAYRLRQAGFIARVVSVHFRFKDLTHVSRQMTLDRATDVTDELFSYAKTLALKLYTGKPIRQVGFRATGLSSDGEQLSFFDGEAHERAKKRDAAIDKLRDKFGSSVIVRGSTLANNLIADERDDYSPFAKS